jgi:hypothetical protein
LQNVVQASLAAIDGHMAQPPIEAVRQLDRQIGDLRLAQTPLSAGRFIMRRARVERPLTALLACAEQARILAGLAQAGSQHDLAVLRALSTNVEARITAMLAGLPQPTLANPAAGGPAANALRQLDQALAMLSERLTANMLDGFAID